MRLRLLVLLALLHGILTVVDPRASAARGDAATSGSVAGRLVGDGGGLRASVAFVWREGEELASAETLSRADGSFRIPVERADRVGALYAWRATLGSGGCASTLAQPVRADGSERTLVLGLPRRVRLVVNDPQGTPLPSFGAHVDLALLERWWPLPGTDLGASQGREATLDLPQVPFRLRVWARGYEERTFAFDEPTAIGAELALALEPVRRVEGVVWHAARAVAGATVRIQEEGEPCDGERRLDGMRWSWRPPFLGAQTDEEGRFSIPVPSAGRYALRAFHAPEGQGALGPLVLDERTPRTGLSVALDRPLGAIEGRVLLPEGRTVAEVGLRLAGPGTVLVDLSDDGRFAAEGLAEGTWSLGVAARDEAIPLVPGTLCPPGWHDADVPPDWVACDVSTIVRLTPGARESVTLDLREPPTSRIEGRVRITGPDGEPLVLHAKAPWGHEMNFGWRPTCHALLEPWEDLDLAERTWLARAPLVDGGFAIGVDRSSSCLLRVVLQLPGRVEWEVVERVEPAPGVQPWSFTAASGALVVRGADEATPALFRGLRWRWRGAHGRSVWVTSFAPKPEPDGSIRFACVPAGEGELVADGAERRVLLRASVAPGGETTVELPR